MVVNCSGCNTQYSIDERKIPPRGGSLTCRGCGTRLKVDPPSLSPDIPARPPATAPAPGSKKKPVPAPRGTPPPAVPPSVSADRGPSAHVDSSASLTNPVSCPKCGHSFTPSRIGAGSASPTGKNRQQARPLAQVLLVEDQHYFTELTCEALEREAETTVAPNLAAARDLLSRKSFDLVILDLSLEGGQDGAQILQAIRQRGIPVLIFTARDETDLYGETWESLKSAGATDILIKGMNVGEDLRQKVQAILANPQK